MYAAVCGVNCCNQGNAGGVRYVAVVVLLCACNGFAWHRRVVITINDIDVLDLRVCYGGEWYNTADFPTLIETILPGATGG
ncbi:hypothetical protein KCP75_00995 [Salmonella enterica subsp. enterica]|nr:hypothetical protein KCP75_00995 [Salmonella enterica subsp. enterica]